MSSHREAPEISKDPVADSTDIYAFVSPDNPDTVTLIANYIPLQGPAGGPNFYEFGDDVLYEIHIDNDGDAQPDITYQFRFTTRVRNQRTFLYNTGPIDSLDDADWNRRQTYSVTKVTSGQSRVLASRVPCPPCNIGPRSTPNYVNLVNMAIRTLPTGEKVFAGQRAEGFYVDLGSIFDLGALRPFQNLHLLPLPPAPGVNATAQLNVHTIALQVPITDLTRNGRRPTDPTSARATIGVYTSASRQKVLVREEDVDTGIGPFVQVSRLGNPLFNEVIVPMGRKDEWNSSRPADDKNFVGFVQRPELAALLPVLCPGVFPNLAALNADRADLVAILLTGIPSGLIPGFQNFTGDTQADLLRLNVAIPPSKSPSAFGLLGGDLAGLPQWAAGCRRRRGDRAACRRGCHLPAGQPGIQTRWCRGHRRRWGCTQGRRYAVPQRVPIPRDAVQRLRRTEVDRVVTTDALVIDIGGDAGALIVYAPEELVGIEIEIARAGNSPGLPIHNVVRARQVGDDVVCAAVFPVLKAGRYVPYGAQTPRDARAFNVLGGRVTELDWPCHSAEHSPV